MLLQIKKDVAANKKVAAIKKMLLQIKKLLQIKNANTSDMETSTQSFSRVA